MFILCVIATIFIVVDIIVSVCKNWHNKKNKGFKALLIVGGIIDMLPAIVIWLLYNGIK